MTEKLQNFFPAKKSKYAKREDKFRSPSNNITNIIMLEDGEPLSRKDNIFTNNFGIGLLISVTIMILFVCQN